MKIKKAIEILTKWEEPESVAETEELIEAIKLGIEALKRLQEHRTKHIDITYRALPGETSE